MNNFFLYFITISIWGSSFFAISFQISEASSIVSVFYRFAIAASVMLFMCIATGRSLRGFSARQHILIALQGAFLFCINFYLIYEAAEYISSGLIATVFSTIVVMNIIGGTLIFKTLIDSLTLVAAAIGLFGILIIFWHDIFYLELNKNDILGLVLAIGGTVSASIGMLMSAWFQKHYLPIIQTNTIGMAYGAAFAALIATIGDKTFIFSPTNSYIFSLVFLVLFASVIAFWSFLTLLGKIGPGRASYAMVFFPILSLGLSTFFENFAWTLNSITGALLIIIGNVLALKTKKGSTIN